MKKPNIYRLTICAIFIALATVLSMIKVYDPPLGGSVTLLSMLPIVLISCMYGLKWGLASSFVYALGQMFLSFGEVCSWGLTPVALASTFVIDYILAYFVLGFSGIFAKKGVAGICIGTVMTLILRFLCHFTTGIVIFDIWLPDSWNNVWVYSLCYNGGYMLPEIIFTCIGVGLVSGVLFKLPQIKRIMKK